MTRSIKIGLVVAGVLTGCSRSNPARDQRDEVLAANVEAFAAKCVYAT
jgi:hypothetical protein